MARERPHPLPVVRNLFGDFIPRGWAHSRCFRAQPGGMLGNGTLPHVPGLFLPRFRGMPPAFSLLEGHNATAKTIPEPACLLTLWHCGVVLLGRRRRAEGPKGYGITRAAIGGGGERQEKGHNATKQGIIGPGGMAMLSWRFPQGQGEGVLCHALPL